ncbi:MAG: hypothetical protein ACXADY_12320 [Candidatus Hodarchaeales archaeon]|jgi:hypothetical protein
MNICIDSQEGLILWTTWEPEYAGEHILRITVYHSDEVLNDDNEAIVYVTVNEWVGETSAVTSSASVTGTSTLTSSTSTTTNTTSRTTTDETSTSLDEETTGLGLIAQLIAIGLILVYKRRSK